MSKIALIFRTLRVSPLIAVMFGMVAVVLILATPTWLFGRFVEASGLPMIVSAAKPPLGATARALAAIFGGLITTAAVWSALWLVRRLVKPTRIAPRGVTIGPASRDNPKPAAAPPSYSAKAARPPIFAERELGAPFMSDAVLAPVVAPPRPREPVFSAMPAPPVPPVPAAPEPVIMPPPAAIEPPPVAEPDAAPVAQVSVAQPLIPPVAAQAAEPSLADLITRLETSLARKRATGAPIVGDIMSLRQSLGRL